MSHGYPKTFLPYCIKQFSVIYVAEGQWFSGPLPGGRGGATQPPNLTKGPLLATKWAKNGVFVGGLRGVRFKKSTFGGLAPPKINPGGSGGFSISLYFSVICLSEKSWSPVLRPGLKPAWDSKSISSVFLLMYNTNTTVDLPNQTKKANSSVVCTV